MADPFWTRFCTPLAERILALVQSPGKGPAQDAPFILEETIDRVLADGRYVVGGDALTTKGTAKLRTGQRVHVFWRRGRRERILTHQWQRAQTGGAAVDVGTVEELFIRLDGPATAAGPLSLWYACVAGAVRLLDRTAAPWLTLPGDYRIRWGADAQSFAVEKVITDPAAAPGVVGTSEFYLYALDGRDTSRRATFLRVERPAQGTLVFGTYTTPASAAWTAANIVTPIFALAYVTTPDPISKTLTSSSYNGLEITPTAVAPATPAGTARQTITNWRVVDFALTADRELVVLGRTQPPAVPSALDGWGLWLVNTTRQTVLFSTDKASGPWGIAVGPGEVRHDRYQSFSSDPLAPIHAYTRWDVSTDGAPLEISYVKPNHAGLVEPPIDAPLVELLRAADAVADVRAPRTYHDILDGPRLPFIGAERSYSSPGFTCTIGLPVVVDTFPLDHFVTGSGLPATYGVLTSEVTILTAGGPPPPEQARTAYELVTVEGGDRTIVLLDPSRPAVPPDPARRARLFFAVQKFGPDVTSLKGGTVPTTRTGVFVLDEASALIATLRPYTPNILTATGFALAEVTVLSSSRDHVLWALYQSRGPIQRTEIYLSHLPAGAGVPPATLETAGPGVTTLVAVVDPDGSGAAGLAVHDYLRVIRRDYLYQVPGALSEVEGAGAPRADDKRFVTGWVWDTGVPTLTLTVAAGSASGGEEDTVMHDLGQIQHAPAAPASAQPPTVLTRDFIVRPDEDILRGLNRWKEP